MASACSNNAARMKALDRTIASVIVIAAFVYFTTVGLVALFATGVHMSFRQIYLIWSE